MPVDVAALERECFTHRPALDDPDPEQRGQLEDQLGATYRAGNSRLGQAALDRHGSGISRRHHGSPAAPLVPAKRYRVMPRSMVALFVSIDARSGPAFEVEAERLAPQSGDRLRSASGPGGVQQVQHSP
jgi:hypothetical protein